jgi:hypothetical protein
VACENPLKVIGVAIGRKDCPATAISIEFGDIPDARALSCTAYPDKSVVLLETISPK